MSCAHRFLLPALVIVAVASPACAVQRAPYRYPATPRAADARAYDFGYDDGRNRGENDARRQRSYDYTRHGEYRDGDDGYRGYGSRNAYRTVYRQGFVAGYNDGYRRYAQAGYGRAPLPPAAYPNRGPIYPAYPGQNGRYVSVAAQNGYRDGYEQGRDDREDRDPFAPIRASRYRDGDRGYNSRYGSRDDYRRDYRAAFQQGYSDGYYQRR